MSGLNMLSTIMIGAIGWALYRESERRKAADVAAAQDRRDIRRVAEGAASDAASCVAVVDRIDNLPRRPRLRAVRDDATRVSTWHWE